MLTDIHLGSYSDTVQKLKIRLQAAVRKIVDASGNKEDLASKFKVVTVGHGGRDSWLALALVEAVAFDEDLREKVQIVYLSCTWPNDKWEPEMSTYLKRVGVTKFVTFHTFQYHREHYEITKTVQAHFANANLVLQCEQGADYFVPPGHWGRHPLTAPFLQDNYEDWTMLYEGLRHVSSSIKAEMWLLQTNTGLDMQWGIGHEAIDSNIFEGQLQAEDTFKTPIPGTDVELIGTAVKLRDLKNEELYEKVGKLGISLETSAEEALTSSLYLGFAKYCAANSSHTIPVASWLEMIVTHNNSQQQKDKLPDPQWLLARHLTQHETDDVGPSGRAGHRSSGLHVWHDLAKAVPWSDVTTAQWIYYIMRYRRMTEEQAKEMPAPPPHAANMVGERDCERLLKLLSIAVKTAESIKSQCPGFDLWRDEELLLRSLEDMRSDYSPDVFKNEKIPSVFEFLRRAPFQTLDYLCRLLESNSVRETGDYISKHYLKAQPIEDNAEDTVKPSFKVLEQCLINGWNAQNSAKRAKVDKHEGQDVKLFATLIAADNTEAAKQPASLHAASTDQDASQPPAVATGEETK